MSFEATPESLLTLYNGLELRIGAPLKLIEERTRALSEIPDLQQLGDFFVALFRSKYEIKEELDQSLFKSAIESKNFELLPTYWLKIPEVYFPLMRFLIDYYNAVQIKYNWKIFHMTSI